MAAQQRKINCGSCNRVTKHNVKAKYSFKEVYDLREMGGFGTIQLDHEYLIVQCAGCDDISFMDIVPNDGGWDVYQYPEPAKKEYQGLFLEHLEQTKLPKGISALYTEVSVAFKNEAPILAGIGLRALVEAICLQQKISAYNLQLKIKELHDRGLISKQELPILDKLRSIGNAAAHKIKPVNEDALRHALLIINHVLRSVYILPGFSKKIKL